MQVGLHIQLEVLIQLGLYFFTSNSKMAERSAYILLCLLLAYKSLLPIGADSAGHHLVLIHGASHGAWCWYKTQTLLINSGQRVSSLDLKSAGINGYDPNLIKSFVEYTQPLVDFMESIPDSEKVVLVGHSFGGLSLAYMVELFPTKILACVYVAAVGTPNGLPPQDLTELISGLPTNSITLIFANRTSDRPTSTELSNISQFFYNTSPPEDVVLAASLVKAFPYEALVNAQFNITANRFGSIPRFYIRTLDDNSLGDALQTYFISRLKPQLVLSIQSDHSPFFSASLHLHKLLLQILQTISTEKDG